MRHKHQVLLSSSCSNANMQKVGQFWQRAWGSQVLSKSKSYQIKSISHIAVYSHMVVSGNLGYPQFPSTHSWHFPWNQPSIVRYPHDYGNLHITHWSNHHGSPCPGPQGHLKATWLARWGNESRNAALDHAPSRSPARRRLRWSISFLIINVW